MKRLTAILLLVILLTGCAQTAATPDEATPDEIVTEAVTDPPTEPPTEPPTLSPQEENDLTYETLKSGKLKKKKYTIELECVYQNPELPAGCEPVALTTALNALGYDVSKFDIVDKYMPYGNELTTSYVGDPYHWGGAGIFPPGLCKTALNFAKKNAPELSAYNTTGTKLSDLYRFIEAGYPVVMWSTYYLSYPNIERTYSYKGHDYPWYINEHCVVLYGYDTKEGTVKIADPQQGCLTYNASEVESVYDNVNRMSMVLIRHDPKVKETEPTETKAETTVTKKKSKKPTASTDAVEFR